MSKSGMIEVIGLGGGGVALKGTKRKGKKVAGEEREGEEKIKRIAGEKRERREGGFHRRKGRR